MARASREGRDPKAHKTKIIRPKRIGNGTLHKLLVANLLLTALSCLPDYEKYIELCEKLIKFLGY